MAQIRLSEREVEHLRDDFSGTVITPDDQAYDEARKVWNGDIDRSPRVIAFCANTKDVQTALAFGRRSGLQIAVRSGGHSLAGHSVVDDGLVIDLRRLNQVSVDPEARRAVVGGGAIWSEVDGATVPHGLAVTGGHVTHTGVAALVLGGGVGHLMRGFGLSSDNLISAELVTADGQLREASASKNDDLFWAIRGGGGNFGIATRLEFQLHPIGETVFGGLLFYAPEQGPDLMRVYNQFAKSTPDEVTTILAYLAAPPAPFVPEQYHFKPGYAVVVVSPDQEVAENAVKPLREFGPLFEMLAPMPYPFVQSLFDESLAPGTKVYWKSHYFAEYSDDVIAAIHANTAKMPAGPSQMINLQMGGAVARVPDDATAFAGRSAGFLGMFSGIWEEADERDAAVAWSKGFADSLAPLSLGGTYPNLAGEESEERLIASYGREKYARLARIKTKYDPDNVFRLNQNIVPAH
ncbi:MAG: FAD-binding oxidoreductase [Chloroflexi bacterium]|nr:MAG: FAD-binding oxidoreductase [Chloroflexota bacterium]